MSLQQYEQYEADRMERNAWKVSAEVASRIDGARVLSQHIRCFVSEKPNEHFFFNGEYIKEYNCANEASKSKVPGSGYIEKINKFQEEHYRVGELFMDYVKKGCEAEDGSLCSWCDGRDWVGAPFKRIPQPMPGIENAKSMDNFTNI